jgi:hypothetical protein
MLDQAKEYLTRVVPWVDGAFVNLHWTVPNKKFDPSKPEHPKTNKKFYLNGQAFTSPDDAVGQLNWLLGSRSDARDIYACMSSQQLAEAKVIGQRSFMEAKRATENVAAIRSLFLDLDVKADGYADTKAALAELRRFIAEVGLPIPTLMVASGTGGAHIYWVLDKALPQPEWQPLANALAEATRRHGLKVDTACTVDSARILRVPQTFNRKGPTPLPVVMASRVQPHDVPLEDMRKILLPYFGATVVMHPNAKTRPGSANAELAGGIQASAARPVDIDTVAPLCGFVKTALDTGGKDYAQPLWNLTTLLATFTLSQRGDGRQVAHAMAAGHKGYSHADTDALYDRKVAEKEARNLGWPSCAAIENAGCGSCAACPLRSLNKSPLSFGQPYVAPVVGHVAAGANGGLSPGSGGPVPGSGPAHSGPLPTGYISRPSGIIAKAVIQEDQSVKLIDVCPYPLHSAWLQSTPWVLHFQAKLGAAGFEAQISISLGDLNSREYGKRLANQGLIVNRHHAPHLNDFLMAWITQLQQTKNAVVASAPFGWSVLNSKLDGFVYNGRVWTTGTDKPAASPDPVLAGHYTPHGDLAPWLAAAAFITDQKRPALDMMLAVAFGAPLMRFTGQSGSIVSAYSTASGIGKTTAMVVSQAVWGHPIRGMNSLGDTWMSVINKAGQLRSLPLMWDELKGEDQKETFVKLAFQISGGKEKSRLNSDATQREAGSWETMVMAASNDSLLNTIQRRLKSTEAGILRVFEYEVPVPAATALTNHGVASRLVAQCHDNYGQAGLVYAKFLGANHQRCADEMAKVQDQLTAKLKAPNDERFWIATMACAIQGARYANELGLTRIDVMALTRFLMDTLRNLRLIRGSTALDIQKPEVLSSVLAQFLSEMAARHTLTTDYVPLGRGRPKPCNVRGDHSRLDVIHVRHGQLDRVFHISQPVLYDWLGKREYNVHTFMEAMKKAFPGGVRTNVMLNLGSGTTEYQRAGMRGYCVVIEYAGKNFKQIMDQVEEENGHSADLS